MDGTSWNVVAYVPQTTLEDLKCKIKDAHGVKVKHQHLFVRGEKDELNNSMPLDPALHSDLFMLYKPTCWEESVASEEVLSQNEIFLEAIRQCDRAQVSRMIEASHPINISDSGGRTSLYWAACEGIDRVHAFRRSNTFKFIVHMLLEACPTEHTATFLEMADARGHTPLFACSTTDAGAIAMLLIRAGADTKHRNEDGLTAFEYAKMHERTHSAFKELRKHETVTCEHCGEMYLYGKRAVHLKSVACRSGRES